MIERDREKYREEKTTSPVGVVVVVCCIFSTFDSLGENDSLDYSALPFHSLCDSRLAECIAQWK